MEASDVKRLKDLEATVGSELGRVCGRKPCLPVGATPWFYRTSAGAEIDLVIERNRQQIYAIEIKRSMTRVLSKGFYLGCEDIGATRWFLVYSGGERYPIAKDVVAISLAEMMEELRSI